MPELLVELFSEEIPARMQRGAAEDLKTLLMKRLADAGLPAESARSYATPRRLALHLTGVPAHQPDRREERKGPRVGAPDQAVNGFLQAAGLTSLDQAERRDRIQRQAEQLAAAHQLSLVGDPALLDEVTGLVEWPVALIGRIDDGFMALPPEVLTTAMRTHQKYFALRAADGRLASHFIVV